MSIPSRFKRSAGEQPGGADKPKTILIRWADGTVYEYAGEIIELDHKGRFYVGYKDGNCSAVFDLVDNSVRELKPPAKLPSQAPRRNWFQKLFGL